MGLPSASRLDEDGRSAIGRVTLVCTSSMNQGFGMLDVVNQLHWHACNLERKGKMADRSILSDGGFCIVRVLQMFTNLKEVALR
jgi:hypothetical protein